MSQYDLYNLESLGWDEHFAGAFRSLQIKDVIPGRVITLEKDLCHVFTAEGELAAQLSGKMRYESGGWYEYPVVGDWVVLKPLPGEAKAIIRALLPRKTKFSRQAAGGRQRLEGWKTEEQVVAANVDAVFLVSGLDGGRSLNLRRIERYLAIARASGANPVIILNKADLCEDIEEPIRYVERIASGLPIHAVSALTGMGLDELKLYLYPGSTAALLGSSGVGKFALINALLGEAKLATGEVREKDKEGRHTTTRRELFLLPDGGMVIDTPGMREIQVWGNEEGLDNAFRDIAELAENCRFADCRHDSEPGCAVREALRTCRLDAGHFKNYLQLQREMRFQLARQDGKAALVEKMRWKQISKIQKRMKRDRVDE